MTGTEAQGWASAVKAVVDALLSIFGGNAGGFVLSWIIMFVLAMLLWRVWRKHERHVESSVDAMAKRMQQCEIQHEACERRNRRLTDAFIDMAHGRRDQALAKAQALADESRACE